MSDTPHYVRFARSLALASATLVTACSTGPTGTSGSCSHAGEACTIGATPVDTCCVCTAPSTEAGPPPAGSPGTWVSPCIGPLDPPELAG